MQIAVIGAGGYIGRNLIARLGSVGDYVIPYSSSTNNVFDARTGVLNDDVQIPKGTDCVVYLAQSPFHRQMPDMAAHLWGVNVVSALKAADLARACGAKRFIYASTGNVYAPSFFPHREDASTRRDDWYALSKVHAEECLALYRNDISITVARIFGVYGPGQTGRLVPNLVQSVRSGVPVKPAPNPCSIEDRGGLKVSLCYIDDVVEIFSQLIHKSLPDVINVAGPESLSIRDIAQAIGERLGVTPKFEVSDHPRAFDLLADITTLVETLNPIFTPFNEGLKRTLEG